MAQTKNKWVAFRTNITVPAAVIGEEKDRKMQVGKPVQLPAGYANHVVHDRFADFCDAPKKAAQKKSGDRQSTEERAAAEAAARLHAAQTQVEEANAALKGVAGTDGEEAARAALAAAETELAALQAAS